MINGKKSRQGLIYLTFRAYVRFVHNTFLYRRIYHLGVENILSDGTPLLIASNHQNCLCDPLGILFVFNDRKPGFLVRADVFSLHPTINKILRKMGLYPAYRLSFDGEASLTKNKEIFHLSEKELLGGRTLLIYPEGMHQDKHLLGDFSLGYTKLAFEAAELDAFQTEIFILPACNHYSAYYDIQQDMLVCFGTPISLQPYYELYKTKPRTAQRKVNTLVREQIESMMLNITDTDNYRAIDFLRNTYGRKYAAQHGFRTQYLPDKLRSDRALFAALEAALKRDRASTATSTTVQQIYDDALTLEREIKKLNIREDHLDTPPPGRPQILTSILIMLLLLPAWIISLWPHLIIYKTPALIMRRVKDKMFHNSFLLGISVLITIPLLYTLSIILASLFVNARIALLYALTLPWAGLFAWYYRKHAIRIRQDIRYRNACLTGRIRPLTELRNHLHQKLNHILNKNE
jgi:1-acyl-sn-glycerol-3-phosphate acyltransferase